MLEPKLKAWKPMMSSLSLQYVAVKNAGLHLALTGFSVAGPDMTRATAMSGLSLTNEPSDACTSDALFLIGFTDRWMLQLAPDPSPNLLPPAVLPPQPLPASIAAIARSRSVRALLQDQEALRILPQTNWLRSEQMTGMRNGRLGKERRGRSRPWRGRSRS